MEGVAQIFYDRIEATCKGKGAKVCSSDDVLLTFLGRVVGLFQKPADLEDASTPENKSEKLDYTFETTIAHTCNSEKNGK